MSRDAQLTIDWADGTYTFRLAWGELITLQEECNAGPFEILRRLSTNTWLMEDISNVIRLSLIGGGIEPTEAFRLVKTYVHSRPPLENVPFARGILGIAVQGAPDEKPGEGEAAPNPESE